MKESEEMDKIWTNLNEKYQIDELVKFSEFDILDKLSENSWQIIRFTELYEKEISKLNKVIEIKEKTYGERYDHYRFDFDKELKQGEIEKYYLPKDDKIVEINKMLRLQQYVVNYFAMCVKALEKVQWNMKTFNDINRQGR